MHEEQKKSFIRRIVKIAKNVPKPLIHGDLWDNILEDLLIKNNWNNKFQRNTLL